MTPQMRARLSRLETHLAGPMQFANIEASSDERIKDAELDAVLSLRPGLATLTFNVGGRQWQEERRVLSHEKALELLEEAHDLKP